MPMNPDFDEADVSPDAARSRPGGAELDPTGITPVMEIMRTAFQFMTAARASGFSPDQSFQIARDWLTTMTRASTERDE